jgi:hypothetical protein
MHLLSLNNKIIASVNLRNCETRSDHMKTRLFYSKNNLELNLYECSPLLESKFRQASEHLIRSLGEGFHAFCIEPFLGHQG